MNRTTLKALVDLAHAIRCHTVRMLARAGSGHLGGSLSLADILAALYGSVLHIDPQHPHDPQRDRFVLSAGHTAPAYYAALACGDYFPIEQLDTLRQMGSGLQGHPSLLHGLPGIDSSSGSLGQGLSVALGFALAARHTGAGWRTYALLGDGELQEGQIWEAAMAAGHYKLANLTAIVDRNGLQIGGPTKDIMEIEPLAQKWAAFGWAVFECQGNDMADLLSAFDAAQTCAHPSVIIAHTVMGCGIPEIEDNAAWHGKVPTPEQVPSFIAQLETHHQRALDHLETIDTTGLQANSPSKS